jgi:hypothetical protein
VEDRGGRTRWGDERTDADRIRLLREYLTGLAHIPFALRRWVDDARAVIGRLSIPPRDSVID